MFAPNWWQSTGYLNGSKPTVDPDDPYRISTAILPVYPPMGWQFQAVGSLYPGADNGWQGGMASYPAPSPAQTRMEALMWDKPAACLDECAMGGCADPTSWVHAACVKQGCCTPSPLPSHYGGEVVLPSQQSYVETNCEPGTKEYCRSDLDYFNCMPYSTLTPMTDPTCVGYTPNIVPW
jgi:hypothetical protein